MCKEHSRKRKNQNAPCKLIYYHEKNMVADPEALTTEFIEDMVGKHCKRLEKEKTEKLEADNNENGNKV
jgi:hypothetical protein